MSQSGTNLLIASYHGLLKFNMDQSQPSVISGNGLGTAYTIVTPDNSNLWLGTNFGAYYYNGSSTLDFTWLNTPMNNDSESMNDIIVDSKGNTWFATDRGLYKKDTNNNWTTFNVLNSGISGNDVTCIEEYNNEFWIGTLSGISKFDGLSNWTTTNSSNSNLPSNSIQALGFYDGKIYVCTDAGIAFAEIENTANLIDFNLSKLRISIYPSIIEDDINISMSNFIEIEYAIYDLNGSTIKQNKLLGKQINVRDLSLSKGIYVLRLFSKKNGINKSFTFFKK